MAPDLRNRHGGGSPLPSGAPDPCDPPPHLLRDWGHLRMAISGIQQNSKPVAVPRAAHLPLTRSRYAARWLPWSRTAG